MSNDLLNGDIRYLKGIGEKRAKLFAALGIRTTEQLINYYPRAYEDWSEALPVMSAPLDETVCVKVKLLSSFTAHGTHSGMTVYDTVARDESGFLGLVFFNNKYVRYSLSEGDEVWLYGKIRLNSNGGREMVGPDYYKGDEAPGLRAVYPLTAGLTSRAISKAVKTALDECSVAIAETLPEEQIRKYRLKTLRDALRLIHFPETLADVEAARRRLIYEELLTLQLGLLRRGKGERSVTECVIKKDYSAEFARLLPYEMTGAQKRAVADCVRDMRSDTAMRRLLQGDVGSGKTAVAASLMYTAVKNGWQCAMMAPTEVLAQQHFRTLSAVYGDGIKVRLLTGSVTAAEKKKIKAELASGEAQIVVGTHAVITGDTRFHALGLAITDEQHRFGVMQRAALRQKGSNPHVLVMSATPIPRTLSLIIFGDLDVSVLDEKPAGRQPVRTYTVTGDYHERLYAFIKKEAAKGGRCFIVCPRVEEDESFASGKLAAESYFETLRGSALGSLRLGLLHGKMKNRDKDAVMRAFADGSLDVLVCTTVVEVGVDVPEANVMIIENAESFGLSQLHQLRGRVGRGAGTSYCVLVSDARNPEALRRLEVMCATDDGFAIADEDLKSRGPGDFFGSRQSGLPRLAIADLMTDTRILTAAGAEARAILAADPELKNPAYDLLRRRTESMFTDIS